MLDGRAGAPAGSIGGWCSRPGASRRSCGHRNYLEYEQADGSTYAQAAFPTSPSKRATSSAIVTGAGGGYGDPLDREPSSSSPTSRTARSMPAQAVPSTASASTATWLRSTGSRTVALRAQLGSRSDEPVAATDIGGTFTDLVVFDYVTGEMRSRRRPRHRRSSPRGARRRGSRRGRAREVAHLVHGTTIVINALTERKGVRTALMTTAGFRDVARDRARQPTGHVQPSLPEAGAVRAPTVAIRGERASHRHGRSPRSTRAGRARSVVEAAESRGSRRSRSASCTPTRIRSTSAPRATVCTRGCPVSTSSTSSDITREWREYERTSTAVLNAYVQPVVDGYLEDLGAVLRRDGLRGTSTSCSRAAAPLPWRRRAPPRSRSSSPGRPRGSSARRGSAEQIGEPNVDLARYRGNDREVLADRGRRVGIDEGVQDRVDADLRPATRSWCPWSTSSRSAPEAAASPGSTMAARSEVGPEERRRRPGPGLLRKGGERPTVTDAKLLAGRARTPSTSSAAGCASSRELAGEACGQLGAPARQSARPSSPTASSGS